MTVTTLPSANIVRFNTRAFCDSLGRVWVHGEAWNNTTDLPDTTEGRAERYDPGTNSWSFLAAPSQFWYGYAAMIDSLDRVIIACGFVATYGVSSTIHNGTDRGAIYNPATDTWTAITTIPPGTAGFNYSVTSQITWHVGDHLWIAGGLIDQSTPGQDFNGAPFGGFVQDTWEYSGGASGTWTKRATALPTAQSGNSGDDPSFFATNGKLYDLGDFYVWNPTTLAWAFVNTTGHQSAPNMIDSTGQFIYDFTNGGTLTARYDTVGDSWIARATKPASITGPVLRSGTDFYMFGWQVGGAFQANPPVYKYDSVANSWSLTADVLPADHYPVIVKDTVGPGWYLVGGSGAGNGKGSNNLEYFTPGTAVAHKRSWAAVIGD